MNLQQDIAASKSAPQFSGQLQPLNLVEGQTARFEVRYAPADDPNIKVSAPELPTEVPNAYLGVISGCVAPKRQGDRHVFPRHLHQREGPRHTGDQPSYRIRSGTADLRRTLAQLSAGIDFGSISGCLHHRAYESPG